MSGVIACYETKEFKIGRWVIVTELMECLDCKKDWPVGGAMATCPHCGSANIRVGGDEEDRDAMTHDFQDEFSVEDKDKRTLGSSVKEVRAQPDEPSSVCGPSAGQANEILGKAQYK